MTATVDVSEGAAIAFVERWQGVTASELATAQSFVIQLCELLGVEAPHPTAAQDYMFERPVSFAHGDGATSAGRIDCYRRGHFVLEAKKLKAGVHTKGFDDALLRARAQAEGYARALPAAEGRPPFLLVVDVGNVIELYAEFSQSGATYTPFPDPRNHRIHLADLADATLRERLRRVWTDPASLNPANASARVTREVSAQLAVLAKSLEQSGHRADHVAAFLTRALFSMFAEDVELLPKGSFLALLEKFREQPTALQQMLRALWADMDHGGFSAALATQVLKFNGKLFKEPMSDGYSLLLNQEQIRLLAGAAKANWREVEPAIFGTLLERALSTSDRHALGAHYTPRAYVERLVLPTVVEPLRADWANAQAAAVVLAHEGKMDQARAEIRKFHHQLCNTRVLDPACGSGNFLYVTLEHLKRLEGEVLNQLEALGETQAMLGLEGETVSPQQLLGLEINERAAALAELVLWIGYLQWHIRTRGNKAVAEPVVHDYGNIETRDAVLAWSDLELAYDADGQLLNRWDGRTTRLHPVTGLLVPDEQALIPQWRYLKPSPAIWPEAEYIVGNPPFIGKLKMREALGDGYVEALREVWTGVPDSADFVMYWWRRASTLVANGKTRRFGFITTNSVTQNFNRRVVQAGIDSGIRLIYAIADHPWVDNADGAAVRIAMTVGVQPSQEKFNENIPGKLVKVIREQSGEYGEVSVTLTERSGVLNADLTIGTDLAEAQSLQANKGLSTTGVIPHGEGMLVTPEEAETFGPDAPVRPYRNGKDLTSTSRNLMVIDCYGLTADDVRRRYPALYQWLLVRVKPERDVNRDRDLREKWWLHRRNNEDMRRSLAELPRYIATVMTSKHRVFQFLDASILPDQMLVNFGVDHGYHLGVLSSRVHVNWALAQGGTLEDRPRYNKIVCFETFPFPDQDTGLTPELRTRIADLAEQIDAHRKRVLSAPKESGLSLTGLYNVMEALNESRALTSKEKAVNDQGQVSVLKDLHDDLDAAVLAAYGWDDGCSKDELLARLVALNLKRAEEEKTGLIRWLRPEFQNPAARNSLSNSELLTHIPQGKQADLALNSLQKPVKATMQPWPPALPEQVRAVAQVLASSTAALPVSAIEASFKGKGPWKKALPRILETLEALGRARREGALWRA